MARPPAWTLVVHYDPCTSARLLHDAGGVTGGTITMELPLIFSLFGAVALTLLVPAIRGMYR